jgi:membrane protein
MLDDSVERLKRIQADMAASLRDDTHTGGMGTPTSLGRGARFVHFWGLVGRFFWRNRCQVRSSALAYTTLLALVPLLAVSLTVASLVFDAKSEQSRNKLTATIEQFVDQIAPTLGLSDAQTPPVKGADGSVVVGEARRADVANRILDFVGNIHFGTIGVTAMVGLIFVAISLLRTIEAAFNDIWGVARGRGWFDSIILYWGAISLGPIVLLVATTSGYLNVIIGDNPTLQQIPGVALLRTQFLPFVVVGSALGMLYKVMPNTRVQWPAALMGGLVAGLLWLLNNRVGVLYNTKVVTYSKIYGSLGAVPLFLVGLYLTWMIVLFGAQVAYVFQNRKAYLQERMAERVHQQGREFVALRFMVEISRRFAHRRSPPSAPTLATLMAVPARLASGILGNLAQSGLITETNGVEPGYQPARPLEQITLHHVLVALRTGIGSDIPTTTDPQRDLIRAEFNAVMEAEGIRGNQVTMADLVNRLPPVSL